MPFESDKTMFEIYREKDFNQKFKVVFYTELTEHNKESEINKALNGETVFDGFLKDLNKEQGKAIIKNLIREMNTTGQPIADNIIRDKLKDYLG